jgi:branched-chain amino acid transport system substrate-binding protein
MKIWKLISIVMMFVFAGACTPQATPEPTAAPNSEAPVATSMPAVTNESVRVAFVGPTTGPGSADLLLAAKGAELAVNQRNAQGGICDGRKIAMEYSDDKADPKEAAVVATKLTGDKGILGVLHGWNSSAVLAAAPIFNEVGLVQVDYYGVSPSIREAGPYTFRVIPTGDLMARYLADWMVNGEGYKKIAGFYENTDFGKGLYDVFAVAVKEFGGEIVANEAVLMDQKDFSAILAKFKAASPDAVVIFGQYEAAAFFQKQAPDVGFNAPLYGSDGIFAPELINLGGAAVEGVHSVSAYTVDSPDPYVANFVKDFRAAFNTDPNNGAGYTYDAMVVLLDGLNGGGCSREGAMKWLTTNVKDKPGVTGKISFDEKGDRLFQQALYQKLIVKDGKFIPYVK